MCVTLLRRNVMAGQQDRAEGKAKELAGKATHNSRLEGEGKGQNAAGKVERTVDQTSQKAKGVVKGAKKAIADR
jgi:uncharacterized protein YjbJ (UPF0337 family)